MMIYFQKYLRAIKQEKDRGMYVRTGEKFDINSINKDRLERIKKFHGKLPTP